MGIFSWLKAFVTGVPTADQAERWRQEDAMKSILRASKPKPSSSHSHLKTASLAPSRAHGKGNTSISNPDFYSGEPSGDHGTILKRGVDGRPLAFQYTKKYGDVSDRKIFNWTEYPQHVQGVCDEKGVLLSFTKSRVTAWYEDSEKMLKSPKGKSRR